MTALYLKASIAAFGIAAECCKRAPLVFALSFCQAGGSLHPSFTQSCGHFMDRITLTSIERDVDGRSWFETENEM